MTGCIPVFCLVDRSATLELPERAGIPGLVLFSSDCDLFCDVSLTPLPHSLDSEIAELR